MRQAFLFARGRPYCDNRRPRAAASSPEQTTQKQIRGACRGALNCLLVAGPSTSLGQAIKKSACRDLVARATLRIVCFGSLSVRYAILTSTSAEASTFAIYLPPSPFAQGYGGQVAKATGDKSSKTTPRHVGGTIVHGKGEHH